MGNPVSAARFRWTIRRKLLALGAGTLVPVALLLAYWVWAEPREATREVEARLRLAGEQAAAQVELLLEGLTGHVEALAAHPEIRGGDARTAARLLRGVAAEHPELEGLLVVDAEGRARVSATPEPVGAGIAIGDRPWFRAVRAGRRPVVGDFQVGRLTGYPVAIVAAPLLGPGQAFEGAVAGGVSLRRLHTLFAGLPFWGGITVTVLDADGRILAHAPGADESLLGRPLPSLGALAEGGRKVSRLAWLDGEERLAGLAHVPRARWRVVASAPSAVVRDRVEREVRAIGLPLLVLLGLAAAAGLLIARRVWRPLEALTAAVTRLPREAALRVRVDSTDEVGDLARAFDEMTVQVETARADLERQIAELGALSEAGRLLTSTLELSQVLQRLAELARARLDVDVVRIWLREGASNDYRLHAQAGATRDPEEFRMHLEPGQGLVGWIMDHREALVLADVQADPRLTNRAWATAEDLHAFLGIPIVLEDTPVGVLACVRRGRREFSADDVKLALLFAPSAAVAILNARLYDEARGRTRQLELLHEAARTVAGEREITRLLQGRATRRSRCSGRTARSASSSPTASTRRRARGSVRLRRAAASWATSSGARARSGWTISPPIPRPPASPRGIPPCARSSRFPSASRGRPSAPSISPRKPAASARTTKRGSTRSAPTPPWRSRTPSWSRACAGPSTTSSRPRAGSWSPRRSARWDGSRPAWPTT